MHSKPAVEEFGQSQTTPEACKVASAMAKTFTFAWHSSRPRPLRSSKKPSRVQKRKPSLLPVAAMIRVFFLELCRLSKQWPRSFSAITHCGTMPSVVAFPNCFTRSPQRTQRDDGERDCQADFG